MVSIFILSNRMLVKPSTGQPGLVMLPDVRLYLEVTQPLVKDHKEVMETSIILINIFSIHPNRENLFLFQEMSMSTKLSGTKLMTRKGLYSKQKLRQGLSSYWKMNITYGGLNQRCVTHTETY